MIETTIASHRYESIYASQDYAVISDETNFRIQSENSNQYSEMPEVNFSVAQSYNPSSYEIPAMSVQVRML